MDINKIGEGIKNTVGDVKSTVGDVKDTVATIGTLGTEVRSTLDKIKEATSRHGQSHVPAPQPQSSSPASASAYKILANSRYHVAIDGIEYAAFSEVSGLQIETETMDFIEGGVNDRVYRLPVRSRVGNITLKRGVTAGNELLKWHLQIVQGYLELKNVTIYVYETSGKLLTRYELLQAFPVKWSGPQFMGTGEAVAVETLELAHAGFLQIST